MENKSPTSAPAPVHREPTANGWIPDADNFAILVAALLRQDASRLGNEVEEATDDYVPDTSSRDIVSLDVLSGTLTIVTSEGRTLQATFVELPSS